MKRWARSGVATACLVLAGACRDDQTEVQRQTQELAEAQKDVARVTEQLGSDLDEAKGEVARLEQKLAMARQGLTDEVLENQRELQEALKAQGQKVESELNEASREAEIHSRDTQAALQALSQTGSGDAPARDEIVHVRGGPDPRHGQADAGAEAAEPQAPRLDMHAPEPMGTPSAAPPPTPDAPAPAPTPAPGSPPPASSSTPAPAPTPMPEPPPAAPN